MLRRLLVLTGLLTSVRGDAQVATPSTNAAQPPIATLDSVMNEGMRRFRIPGGAYVLVSGGRIVASRGFGFSNVSTRKRVNPDSTVFGLSSTTKLFTSIAAARLAREGLIDLDGPIAPYLSGTALSARVDDITVSRLLTHTAGLDDPTIGSAARSSDRLLPLKAYLERAITEPWVKPGTITSYSNAGVALAGHVLSLAANRPFEDLVDSAVFAGFGMRRSSVRQPLPAVMQAHRATPYAAAGDNQTAIPRIFFNDAPASAGYATAHDMGLLMSSLLRPASPHDSAVASSLFSRRFTNHPAVPGMTLGFRESLEGEGIYEHGGDWQDYSNSLWLDRVSGTGLFVIFSSSEGQATARDLWKIVKATLPQRPSRFTFRARSSAAGCSDAAGTYRDTRMSRHTIAKVGALTGDIREVRITEAPAGIELRDALYRDMGGGVFQSNDGRTVALRCEDGGRPSHLFLGSAPSASYRRLDAAESRGVQGGMLLLAFIATVGAVVADVRRRRERNGLVDTVPRVIRVVASITVIAFFIAMVFTLVSVSPWDFQYGLPAVVSGIQKTSIGLVIAVSLAVVLSVSAVVTARARAGVLELALAIPAVLLLLLMFQWSLAVL
jgi:CubicO group peptidase (beta-lactamase class C family)